MFWPRLGDLFLNEGELWNRADRDFLELDNFSYSLSDLDLTKTDRRRGQKISLLEDKDLKGTEVSVAASRVSILGVLSNLMPHQVQENLS